MGSMSQMSSSETSDPLSCSSAFIVSNSNCSSMTASWITTGLISISVFLPLLRLTGTECGGLLSKGKTSSAQRQSNNQRTFKMHVHSRTEAVKISELSCVPVYQLEDLNGRTLSNRALIGAFRAVDGTLVSYHVSLHFLLRCGSPFQRSQASVIRGFLTSRSPQQILLFLSVFLLCSNQIVYFSNIIKFAKQ
jgi:hypothetical protein